MCSEVELNINGIKFESPLYWIYGEGKWQDEDGTIYNIDFISYPATANGKHVYIDSQDSSASYRSLDEGVILSFNGSRIEMK